MPLRFFFPLFKKPALEILDLLLPLSPWSRAPFGSLRGRQSGREVDSLFSLFSPATLPALARLPSFSSELILFYRTTSPQIAPFPPCPPRHEGHHSSSLPSLAPPPRNTIPPSPNSARKIPSPAPLPSLPFPRREGASHPLSPSAALANDARHHTPPPFLFDGSVRFFFSQRNPVRSSVNLVLPPPLDFSPFPSPPTGETPARLHATAPFLSGEGKALLLPSPHPHMLYRIASVYPACDH